MKRKDFIIMAIVLVFVAAVIWLIIYFTGLKKTYNWSESYQVNSDQPFGTSVISELMESYFAGKEFTVVKNDIAKELTKTGEGHRTYVCIGEYPYYTDSVFGLLESFVHDGNDAFLAIKDIPEQLSSEIFRRQVIDNTPQDTVYYITDTGDTSYYLQDKTYADDPDVLTTFHTAEIPFNFIRSAFHRDSSWRFQLVIEENNVPYDWIYFLPKYLNSVVDYTPEGSLYTDQFCNFIKVPWGEGNFYIHTDPIVFTNYFQIQKQQLDYTSRVLSYLQPGDIIWDESSKTYVDNTQLNNDDQSAGPLNFILSQPSLRYAWYSLLAALLLFIVFRAKRTQQSIPVLEPNVNRSLEFVQTIGRMYFLRKNHKQLAQQKMKLLLHFISERYQLNTKLTDDAFFAKLGMKSEVSNDSIQAIFKHYRYIENTHDVTDHDLILLHQLIDVFYKHCK